jgi:hypothetical protein
LEEKIDESQKKRIAEVLMKTGLLVMWLAKKHIQGWFGVAVTRFCHSTFIIIVVGHKFVLLEVFW